MKNPFENQQEYDQFRREQFHVLREEIKVNEITDDQLAQLANARCMIGEVLDDLPIEKVSGEKTATMKLDDAFNLLEEAICQARGLPTVDMDDQPNIDKVVFVRCPHCKTGCYPTEPIKRCPSCGWRYADTERSQR